MFINAKTLGKKLIRFRRTRAQVFDFLILYYETNRTSPTLAEIASAIDVVQDKKSGTTSKTTILAHLDALEVSGLIERPMNGNRRMVGKILILESTWTYKGRGLR